MLSEQNFINKVFLSHKESWFSAFKMSENKFEDFEDCHNAVKLLHTVFQRLQQLRSNITENSPNFQE